MRRAGLIAVVAVVVAGACTGDGPRMAGDPDASRPRPPNVLIIVTDDQRYDSMAALPETRSIFSGGGTTFTNAFATTPLCCPARASIMTGQYSHNHGVLENVDGDRLPQRRTLQARLHRAGYTTGIAGKYLQGRPVSENPPMFDRWTTVGWGYYERTFNVDGEMTPVPGYSTDFISKAARRYLRDFEREDDRPWYLYIAPNAPHLPYTPAKRYTRARVERLQADPALREADLGDKPEYFGDPRISDKTGISLRRGRDVFQRQMRTLLAVDDMVSELFTAMDRLDEADDTIAFFTSDNGHLLGEHGLFGKRLPYEASVRVPMFMRWPGHVPGGAKDHRLVAGIDIAPTVLEAAGVGETGAPVDGWSLLSDRARNMLLLEQYLNGYIPDWVSLLTPDAQYVEYLDRDTGERLYGEFYDLRKDRWQVKNLLSTGDPRDLPRAARAARRLAAVIDCSGEACP